MTSCEPNLETRLPCCTSGKVSYAHAHCTAAESLPVIYAWTQISRLDVRFAWGLLVWMAWFESNFSNREDFIVKIGEDLTTLPPSMSSWSHFWDIIINVIIINKKVSYHRDSACRRSLRRSRSFKVTDFGTSRKPVCGFLLVNTTNSHPI